MTAGSITTDSGIGASGLRRLANIFSISSKPLTFREMSLALLFIVPLSRRALALGGGGDSLPDDGFLT